MTQTIQPAVTLPGHVRTSEQPTDAATRELEVRQARWSDQPAIAAFIREAYGELAPFKDARRWNWQFRDNPFAERTDGLAPVCIAVDGERVVGQVAVQPSVVLARGEVVRAGWLVDVMILPAYRGRGLGHRLHDGAAKIVPALITLTMAPATRRMAERAGCINLGPVQQYTRWGRLTGEAVHRYLMMRTELHPQCRSVARAACGGLGFHHLFSAAANVALRVRDLVSRRARGDESLEMVEVDRFGEEVDQLWERVRDEYPMIVPRDALFLNWRFVDCPDLTYRRIIARRSGQTVGYVVLRRCRPEELPLGVVVDVFASRGDSATIEALMRQGMGIFGNEVAAVECATSDRAYAAVLRRLGFYVTRTKRPTCVCEDAALRDQLAPLNDEWFLSKADHDWDQVHLA